MQKKLVELEQEYCSNYEKGLLTNQVEVNQNKYGKNVLEEKKKTPLILKFLSEFKDPLNIEDGNVLCVHQVLEKR